jgi:hypothetical protein
MQFLINLDKLKRMNLVDLKEEFWVLEDIFLGVRFGIGI